jgi:hypothetical protein
LISFPGQATAHVLALHTSPSARQLVPALPVPPTPQPVVAPQYWLLLVGSTHVPLQLISLPGHVTAQPLGVQTSALLVQFWPALPWPFTPQPAVAPQYWLFAVGSMQLPPQLISFPGHETEHCPLPHTCPAGHVTPALPEPLPHPDVAPQCWLLVDGSTQPPLQLISAPGHETEHDPPEQTCPLGHEVPPVQPAPTPQCWLLFDGSTQVPLQFTSLPGQDTEQVPLLQTWPLGHALPALPMPPVPQPAVAPQCALLVVGSTQEPLQLISLPGQETEQAPPLQT